MSLKGIFANSIIQNKFMLYLVISAINQGVYNKGEVIESTSDRYNYKTNLEVYFRECNMSRPMASVHGKKSIVNRCAQIHSKLLRLLHMPNNAKNVRSVSLCNTRVELLRYFNEKY